MQAMQRHEQAIRHRRWKVACASMLLAVFCCPVSAPARGPVDDADQAVEQYLQDHGLIALLAQHLGARLASAPPDLRGEIAQRLAAVYAQLLEQASTAAEQDDWERKGRELLENVPEADSVELRISLARASFTRAERVAERRRLRLGPQDEIETTVRQFGDLVLRFRDIAGEANRRVEALERQEEAGRGDSEVLSQALAESRRHRSLAHYLAGWSCTYIAELTGRSEPAAEAMLHFTWILNGIPGKPATIERLPEQTLKYDHVARAALAMGHCAAMRGDLDSAFAWFNAVERAPEVSPSAIELLPTMRMMALARAERWNELEDLTLELRRDASDVPAQRDEKVEKPRPLSSALARLLAVLTLEAQPRLADDKAAVERLMRTALSDLMARGEMGHVLDLATLFGQDRLGTEGFVANHARGLKAYNEARAAHRAAGGNENEPTQDSEAGGMYLAAADLFRHALREPDAGEFEAARGSTAMLLGLSLYYGAGTHSNSRELWEEAAEWFELASRIVDDRAKDGSGGRASEALWMAVRSLDLALGRAGDDAGLERRRGELIDRYLAAYPDSPRAAALTVRRATDEDMSPRESIELLLKVPEGSALYETARRQASRLAYDMYRAAAGADRDWLALRFAEIAEPVLALDRRWASSGDTKAAERAAVLARRIIDAMMGMTVPNPDRAERALDTLMSLVSARVVDAGPIAGEIEYRRAQIALARGDRVAAERIADGLPQIDPRFAEAAARMFYRDALLRLRIAAAQDPNGEDAREAARLVVKYGKAIIAAAPPTADGPEDPALLGVYAEVAQAAASLWAAAQDMEMRDLGVLLFKRVLRSQPNDARALRGLAELAESIGGNENEVALGCWRMLIAGREPLSEPWFEAKWRLLTLLERVDPDRAREVLAQHMVLYPDVGPAPWAERFRELERRLSKRGSSTTGSDASPRQGARHA